MHYHPMTEDDKRQMLAEIGVSSFEDLLRGVPKGLRDSCQKGAGLSAKGGSASGGKSDPSAFGQLPEGLSEIEIQRLLQEFGSRNATARNCLSFLGGGSYEHFIPSAVAQITGRQEFYTAYTPYQAEASQGTLQAIYEFQSLITELTGLDISNASHYDGATSMAEAALLALRHTERGKILVARSVHPHYRQVLKTYLEGMHYEIEGFDFHPDKTFNRRDFSERLKDNAAGAIFQTPNFFGVIENLEGISEELHAHGALLIVTGHPLSMTVLKSPGEWGADVACGEGQPLGIPLQFGGPYLGYFSTTRALMRRIPGRLCGLTQDSDGRRAFALTLQAREQHIRRERAASNICTNQALCALAACVYMTLLGKEGMHEAGELNLDRAHYLRQKISELRGYSVDLKTPIFNEFVVKGRRPYAEIQKKLMAKKILPGIDLSPFYPQMENHFLVCATETKTKEDLDNFAEALSQC